MGKNNIYQLKANEPPNQLVLKADRALAKLAGSGDRDAFKQIVDANKQRMFTVARSVVGDASLAEDVVQESFIKAYRALPEFRAESRISTWLHRITYLTAIDLKRQQQRHLKLVTDEHSDIDVADDSNEGIREEAIESLADLRDSAANLMLLDIARNHPSVHTSKEALDRLQDQLF